MIRLMNLDSGRRRNDDPSKRTNLPTPARRTPDAGSALAVMGEESKTALGAGAERTRKKQTPRTRSRNLAPENTRRSWLDPTRTSSAQCSSMNHYQQARYAWSSTSSRPTFCCLPSILTIEATKPLTCRFAICHGPLRARIPKHPIQPRFAPPLIHHQETPAPSTPSHHRSPTPASLRGGFAASQ